MFLLTYLNAAENPLRATAVGVGKESTAMFVGDAEDVMRLLKLSLTEFSLPKFYQLFGISKVKSAAVSAFRSSYRPGDRSFAYTPPEQERVSLQSLEVITDALLEIMEVCDTLCH